MSLDPSSFMHVYKQAPDRSMEKLHIEYAAHTYFTRMLMREFVIKTKPNDRPFAINAMRLVLNVIALEFPDDYKEALNIMPEEMISDVEKMLSDAEEMFTAYQKSDLPK